MDCFRRLLLLPLLAAPVVGQAPDIRQVHWQRSLEDALSLQRETGRPILVALNMDGESASDRIVHENYRDPAFVTASRACICVVGSLFRHNPRDHDDEGRRIPSPVASMSRSSRGSSRRSWPTASASRPGTRWSSRTARRRWTCR
jgi:hypothetical protein